MRRLLLVVAILYVVWRVLNAMGRRLARRSPGADAFSRFSAAGRRRRGEAERLVPCSRCGTLVPASRALTDGSGRPVCGPACREAHRGEPGE